MDICGSDAYNVHMYMCMYVEGCEHGCTCTCMHGFDLSSSVSNTVIVHTDQASKETDHNACMYLISRLNPSQCTYLYMCMFMPVYVQSC